MTRPTLPRTSPRAALVALIVAASFVLSFTAMSATANITGLFPKPWGGGLWAVSVDGFILLGSLSYSTASGSRERFLYGSMIGFGLAVSVGFQIVHAAGSGDLAVAVSVVPPVALALSIEAWRRLRLNTTLNTEPSTHAEHSAPVQEVPELNTNLNTNLNTELNTPPRVQKRASRKRSTTPARGAAKARATELAEHPDPDGKTWTVRALADAAGVSVGTAREVLAGKREPVTVSSNGDGPAPERGEAVRAPSL